MAARKWANPGCTPEMIRDCDAKIRKSRADVKKDPVKGKAFMDNMAKLWHSLKNNGEDDLGWEQMLKMQDILAPEIDKINAPH